MLLQEYLVFETISSVIETRTLTKQPFNAVHTFWWWADAATRHQNVHHDSQLSITIIARSASAWDVIPDCRLIALRLRLGHAWLPVRSWESQGYQVRFDIVRERQGAEETVWLWRREMYYALHFDNIQWTVNEYRIQNVFIYNGSSVCGHIEDCVDSFHLVL